jgi:hypothetical protein
MDGLILHRGAEAVTRDQILALPAPKAQGRFHAPVPHGDFIGSVSQQLTRFGLSIEKEQYGLSKDGAKLFGVIHVSRELAITTKAGLVIGLRSSTDESFAMQGVAGGSVFVSDNMVFSGETVMFSRKHTTHVRLDITVERGVTKVLGAAEALEAEIRGMAAKELTDVAAGNLFAQIAKNEILPDRYVGKAIRAYFTPEAEDTAPRSVWGVHNAFTRTLRESSLATKMEHTQSLSRYLAAA